MAWRLNPRLTSEVGALVRMRRSARVLSHVRVSVIAAGRDFIAYSVDPREPGAEARPRSRPGHSQPRRGQPREGQPQAGPRGNTTRPAPALVVINNSPRDLPLGPAISVEPWEGSVAFEPFGRLAGLR